MYRAVTETLKSPFLPAHESYLHTFQIITTNVFTGEKPDYGGGGVLNSVALRVRKLRLLVHGGEKTTERNHNAATSEEEFQSLDNIAALMRDHHSYDISESRIAEQNLNISHGKYKTRVLL